MMNWMGVLPVTKRAVGEKIAGAGTHQSAIITDFNRVRLEFVGHYRDVCEKPGQQYSVVRHRAK